MRYFDRVLILAIVVAAAACQPFYLLADESSLGLIGRLGPVAYWSLADGDGRILLDSTDRHVGLAQGGVSVVRRGAMPIDNDCAIAFDGRNGCVIVRHHDDFLLEQGTITCWVKAADVNHTQGVLSKDASGFGQGGHLTLSIDKQQFVVRLQSSSASHEVRAELRKNQWTHVAFSFGGKGMQLFVDGQLADSHTYAGGLGASSGGTGNREPLAFGASTMTSQANSELPLDSFFHGELDEVAFFARRLEQTEIAELVAATKPEYTSLVRAYVANNPTSWWRLNEPDLSLVANDQVGRQHGTYHVIGSAHFDGDDYVDVGALDLSDESWTILAHIKSSSFTVSDARIVAKENGLNEDDQFWSLGTTVRDDQPRIRFRLNTDHGMREAVSESHSLTVNERVFVAASYDGEKMRLYQNGELVSEVAHHGRPKTNAHCHVWIGDTASGAGERPFDGTIHDVAILGDAITPDQVRAIFRATSKPANSPARASPELLPHAIEPAAPFVHRCPLCDIRYRELLIHRVPLPATSFPPIRETPSTK